MYAIIETGGKQIKVAAGDVVYVEKLNAAEGETVTLSAPIADLPAGFTVKWTADNENFTITENQDGSISITPAANGSTTFKVTVTDAENNVVSEDSIMMTAVVENADDGADEEEPWWMKIIKWIINFFKKLIEIIVDFVTSLGQ